MNSGNWSAALALKEINIELNQIKPNPIELEDKLRSKDNSKLRKKKEKKIFASKSHLMLVLSASPYVENAEQDQQQKRINERQP